MSSSHRPRGRHDRGASAVEYALLVAGIAAVIVAVIYLLGGQVSDLFDGTCDSIKNETKTGTCP